MAFSEALRQEVAKRHVRVAVVEPAAVATEFPRHMRDEMRQHLQQGLAGIELRVAEDIADAIAYNVTRPRRVAVNDLLIRPTEQEA